MTDERKPASVPGSQLREQPSGQAKPDPKKAPEVGGIKGPDPTRYGDWERNGRCIDF